FRIRPTRALTARQPRGRLEPRPRYARAPTGARAVAVAAAGGGGTARGGPAGDRNGFAAPVLHRCLQPRFRPGRRRAFRCRPSPAGGQDTQGGTDDGDRHAAGLADPYACTCAAGDPCSVPPACHSGAVAHTAAARPAFLAAPASRPGPSPRLSAATGRTLPPRERARPRGSPFLIHSRTPALAAGPGTCTLPPRMSPPMNCLHRASFRRATLASALGLALATCLPAAANPAPAGAPSTL